MSAREVESIFAEIVERARASDPTNARTWFDALKVVRFDGGSIGIGCPDEASVRFLEQNCKANFTRIAQQITSHLVTVDFLIGTGGSQKAVELLSPGPALHADYTFDNFVVGPSNRLAHASCVAVSQSLGATYNPLFLYGNAGLGKTHLLHAVCHEIRHRSSTASIQLLSCEEFVNRFIRAIEQGNIASFSQRVPHGRCSGHRRHPVPAGAGAEPGGVLPHVQRPLQQRPADHSQRRQPAGRDSLAGGPADQPVQLGPGRADRPAELRDARGDRAEEGPSPRLGGHG